MRTMVRERLVFRAFMQNGEGSIILNSSKEITKDQLDELGKLVSDNFQVFQKGGVKDGYVEVNAKDKKISVKDISTPWAWLRTSLSIGIRF